MALADNTRAGVCPPLRTFQEDERIDTAVLGYVLDGYSDGQIARKLRISPERAYGVRTSLRSRGLA